MHRKETLTRYRGRFAPSPTGSLHMGSLVAALGSYLQAKSEHGEWLVRIEDLDPPREVPGSADKILLTLDHFGFEWDGPVLYQSKRSEIYDETLRKLQQNGLSYSCGCTRTEIAANGIRTESGLVYLGTCRQGLGEKDPRATRVITRDEVISFLDRLQGSIQQHLPTEVGDFVIKRADGQYAYQLAVVVDDAEQGITEVVRGADLLHSTPRQIYLQKILHLPTPEYIHLPIITNSEGEKLSKQSYAREISTDAPVEYLVQAIRYLGHTPPEGLEKGLPADFWDWALENWNLELVARQQDIMETSLNDFSPKAFER